MKLIINKKIIINCVLSLLRYEKICKITLNKKKIIICKYKYKVFSKFIQVVSSFLFLQCQVVFKLRETVKSGQIFACVKSMHRIIVGMTLITKDTHPFLSASFLAFFPKTRNIFQIMSPSTTQLLKFFQ